MSKVIEVEVAYATLDEQIILKLTVEATLTVGEIIAKSLIVERFPEINVSCNPVGIFSQQCNLNDRVKAGDRIEIYRSLSLDPKEARRLRAHNAGQVLRKKRSRVFKQREHK